MVSAKVTNRLVVSLRNCFSRPCPAHLNFPDSGDLFQVAHMTKNELDYLDTALIGPAMLFLNQYFNFFFEEYHVLWSCLVSFAFRSFPNYRWTANVIGLTQLHWLVKFNNRLK